MDARLRYLQGDYKGAGSAKNDLNTMGYKIGALVFTAQHDEARLLFNEFADRLRPDGLIVARFHIGISFIRTSQYDEARRTFRENLRLLRLPNLSPISGFYICQGISFYRFFFSQFHRSQNFAHRAYSFLLRDPSPPPLLRALSLDIQGHNLAQLGNIHQGMAALKKALDITRENRLVDLGSEIEISYHLYASEFDDDVERQLNKLKKMHARIDSTNDYSHSEFTLEIAKLLLLSGRFLEANRFLTENFRIIYKNRNRRKIAKLNIIMAQLFYWKGQFIEALSIIKIAQDNLDKRIDTSLLLSTFGIEAKILRQLSQDTKDLDGLCSRKVEKIDRHLNRRIQNRLSGKTFHYLYGEDRLGEAFDRVAKKDAGVLDLVLDKRILLLVPKFFDLRPHQRALIFFENRQQIVSIDRDGISLHDAVLSKIQIKILNRLKNGGASKAQLIQDIWGYSYEALRHDSLVYSSMARLRKSLGQQKNWISSDEDRYYFESDIQLIFPASKAVKEIKQKKHEKTEFSVRLNYRQTQMIDERHRDFVGVSDYGKRFKVTRMTALRDLRELCSLGYMQKSGAGKSTRYRLRASPKN